MADGVHAAMESVEKTSGDSALDGRARYPKPGELPTRHDAVLPSGKLGDRLIHA